MRELLGLELARSSSALRGADNAAPAEALPSPGVGWSPAQEAA